MEQNIQFIRSICIKDNPSILDLVFGCEVLMKQYKGDDMDMINYSISKPVPIISNCDAVSGIERLQYIDNFGNVGTDGFKKYLKGEEEGFVKGKSRVKEILGRPIRLTDVLYSMSKIKGNMLTTVDVLGYVRNGQGFSERSYLGNWNLLKDDLTLQSPETIEFISSLLKSN